MTGKCPTCGQALPRGHMVRWPPIKQEIFTTIASYGEVGASTEDIINAVYVGRRRPLPGCIKSHIWQMNEALALEASHLRIVRDDGRYELRRVKC